MAVPRLRGTFTPMVITYLVPAGTRVKEGDVLVEFDPQEQRRLALDKRAELVDLEGQIAKKTTEQAAAEAKDTTELKQAENDVARARLDVKKNPLVATVEAEKNTLALEQATARLEQLRTTFKLKREAAAADLRILEIRRDRSQSAMLYAEKNAELMQIRAPFAGLVVIKTQYRGGSGLVPIVEGDEVRPGAGVIDIVDTSEMQVRARVNQADGDLVRAGQAAQIRLDGFPELRFQGRVEQLTPLATPSQMSMMVRSFTAVISIQGTHEQLLPDLTASVEIQPGQVAPATQR
ncbi:MAG TPA: efflux RND transporter periplasmic adaptor subunit [Vicinamibacterales bacterium]|nr:efflux RND transporter periplasmic adaptor subunit [Vicinamibacterales bacterium]